MTNTIHNVPRELLADLLGNDHDKRIMAERHLLAMLANAPSPAGVDGLEVVEYQERSIYGNWNRIYKLAYDKRLAAGCPEQFRTLSVTADATAIIDGLRGDVEVMTQHANNYSRMFEECAEERDQQAQRIGELEGLLMRVQVSLSLDDTEWGYSGAEKYKLLADIRTAMSAGKEGE